jgi:alpha-beta hydrolase superfamily lysophospholipase
LGAGGSRGRSWIVAIAAIAIVALGASAGVGWYYATQILGPDAPPGRTGQRVLAHTDSTITLAATPKARRPGYWAIVWPGGFGKIGPLLAVEGDRVVTRFAIAAGTPPDTTSRLAGFAWDADPRTWLGVDFEAVTIPARIGPVPAWLVPGVDSTWAVFVHGRAATRAEVLRMLPGYMSLGLPCLIASYRNHEGAPRVGDGSYRLGATEWQDLEDAVRYARSQGARRVVVVGCSMGGGLVAQYLRRSDQIPITSAAVLDAPALDWRSMVELGGMQRGVPPPVTALGRLVTSLRSGLRWDDLSQIVHAREFATPMLIVHGKEDATVPFETSQRFAAARPDLVTFESFSGAGHVESANVDPARYAAAVTSWLSARGIGVLDRR